MKPYRGARIMAAALGAALIVATPAVAWADPSYPSQDDVDSAKDQESLARKSVEQLEDLLARLSDEADAKQVEAESAAETYNQATVDLQDASAAADEATAQAEAANRELESARAALARIALVAYQSADAVSQLDPFLSSDGLQDTMQRAELLDYLGTDADRATERANVAETAAKAAATRKAAAVAQREKVAKAAEDAKNAAAKAAADAQAAQQSAAQQRDAAIAELAKRRDTTVALERQRQEGIEAERQAAAEEAARRAREKAAADAAAAAQAAAAAEAAANDSSSGGAGRDDGSSRSGGTARTDPVTPAEPTTPEAPSDASAGEAAVAWARAQIGKPYKWAATGPDSFDCSGLTSQAWQNGGGKWITRTSRSQYAAAVKISYDQMRPGDLIFWTSNGAASGIHHVAIYSGNGMMIEAPRTGLNVREVSVRWSKTMPYAGRP